MLEVLQRRMDEAYKRIMDKESRMTKTVCDICGKEMPTSKYADTIEDMNFCISSHGRIWDICEACRIGLNKWMTIRKAKREKKEGTDV